MKRKFSQRSDEEIINTVIDILSEEDNALEGVVIEPTQFHIKLSLCAPLHSRVLDSLPVAWSLSNKTLTCYFNSQCSAYQALVDASKKRTVERHVRQATLLPIPESIPLEMHDAILSNTRALTLALDGEACKIFTSALDTFQLSIQVKTLLQYEVAKMEGKWMVKVDQMTVVVDM